jgi:hypothetical protein
VHTPVLAHNCSCVQLFYAWPAGPQVWLAAGLVDGASTALAILKKALALQTATPDLFSALLPLLLLLNAHPALPHPQMREYVHHLYNFVSHLTSTAPDLDKGAVDPATVVSTLGEAVNNPEDGKCMARSRAIARIVHLLVDAVGKAEHLFVTTGSVGCVLTLLQHDGLVALADTLVGSQPRSARATALLRRLASTFRCLAAATALRKCGPSLPSHMKARFARSGWSSIPHMLAFFPDGSPNKLAQ